MLTVVPVSQQVLITCINIAEDKRLVEDHKQEVDTLQRKVSELQAEYKVELKKAKDLSEVCNIG